MNVTPEKIPAQLLPVVGALVLSLAINGLFAAGFAVSFGGPQGAHEGPHGVITVEAIEAFDPVEG